MSPSMHQVHEAKPETRFNEDNPKWVQSKCETFLIYFILQFCYFNNKIHRPENRPTTMA